MTKKPHFLSNYTVVGTWLDDNTPIAVGAIAGHHATELAYECWAELIAPDTPYNALTIGVLVQEARTLDEDD